MNPFPVKLDRLEDAGLRIIWNDGQVLEYTVRGLRENCPCATCREKKTEKEGQSTLLPVLSPEEARPLTIHGMKPVGNYAYSIEFSDGHDMGIYSFELLRSLGTESSSMSE